MRVTELRALLDAGERNRIDTWLRERETGEPPLVWGPRVVDATAQAVTHVGGPLTP